MIYGLLMVTAASGRAELALIAAQRNWSTPATPSNRCVSVNGPSLFQRRARGSVSEDLDIGAQGIQPVGQVLVPPVNDVHVPQHRLRERLACWQNADRGSECGGTDHLLAAPAVGLQR